MPIVEKEPSDSIRHKNYFSIDAGALFKTKPEKIPVPSWGLGHVIALVLTCFRVKFPGLFFLAVLGSQVHWMEAHASAKSAQEDKQSNLHLVLASRSWTGPPLLEINNQNSSEYHLSFPSLPLGQTEQASFLLTSEENVKIKTWTADMKGDSFEATSIPSEKSITIVFHPLQISEPTYTARLTIDITYEISTKSRNIAPPISSTDISSSKPNRRIRRRKQTTPVPTVAPLPSFAITNITKTKQIVLLLDAPSSQAQDSKTVTPQWVDIGPGKKHNSLYWAFPVLSLAETQPNFLLQKGLLEPFLGEILRKNTTSWITWEDGSKENPTTDIWIDPLHRGIEFNWPDSYSPSTMLASIHRGVLTVHQRFQEDPTKLHAVSFPLLIQYAQPLGPIPFAIDAQWSPGASVRREAPSTSGFVEMLARLAFTGEFSHVSKTSATASLRKARTLHRVGFEILIGETAQSIDYIAENLFSQRTVVSPSLLYQIGKDLVDSQKVSIFLHGSIGPYFSFTSILGKSTLTDFDVYGQIGYELRFRFWDRMPNLFFSVRGSAGARIMSKEFVVGFPIGITWIFNGKEG